MKRDVYTLKKPASWHGELWREALPLGNGLTGVLIPGSIGKECIHFNRHDLWEGGVTREIPDVTDAFRTMRELLDKGDYDAANKQLFAAALREKGYSAPLDCPHPLGWLDIIFNPNAVFKNYRRGIDMSKGEAFVEFNVNGYHFSRRAFVSRDCDVTVIRMKADRPFTMHYSFRLYNEVTESVTDENGLYRASKDGYTAVRVGFSGDFKAVANGEQVSVTGTDYTVFIRCGSNGSDTSLDAVRGKSYEELLAAHAAIHGELYGKVSIELADESEHDLTNEQMLSDAYEDEASAALIERLWRFGRYLFISASSPDGLPVPLYGIWHGKDHLTWSQYVVNENVQVTYWHALAGGLSYALPPLIRYYTQKTEKLRECAKKLFGARGIWLSAYTTPHSSGVNLPVAIVTNWTGGAGWLCRHFWEYYQYSGDKKLLEDEILPFMHEAALFWLDYAVNDGEYIRLYPSVSPENFPAGVPGVVAQNATMDFAILKELLTNLLEGIRITGRYTDEADSFKELLAKIPPYAVNSDGAVKEWMHPDLLDNYNHRHLAHLYPVFPGSEITQHGDPELFEAFKKAVMLRKLGAQSGWSFVHMASTYARMGEGERAVGCIDAMAKNVIMDSLLTTHNDWRNMGTSVYWRGDATVQLDAAFGAVNAVQEMLFRCQGDELYVLPSLPKRLACGSVKGIAFPEGSADIVWDADGKVTLKVRAERALNKTVIVKGKESCRITLEAGQSRVVEL